MKNKFLSQYKDPRWQKKRLQILERDNFECRSCTDNTQMLHVHHLLYDSNAKVWEYDDKDLITLCDTCHQAIHYLESNRNIGIETFTLVVRLLDNIESESISEFLARYHNKEYHE
jgi:5-methylcytosine-specific restriction endonuclease McrA